MSFNPVTGMYESAGLFKVTVKAGKNNVVAPNGKTLQAGESTFLTQEEYARLSNSDFTDFFTDNGAVAGSVGVDRTEFDALEARVDALEVP